MRARTAGTNYHVHLTLDDSLVPGSTQIFNNHIPLDPILNAALAISKTTPMLNVTRGQLVPYTIIVRNVRTVPLLGRERGRSLPGRLPLHRGFRAGRRCAVEPTLVGRELTWTDLTMDVGAQRTIVLMLAVGAGVGEGEFVNRAQAFYGLTRNASCPARLPRPSG